jgi:hypothetical protein
MGLFAPWFLAGLAGLALPLYLHLLKRQTTTPKPVSSLMFFESRTQSLHPSSPARYFLLLSLRLLVLLLLILAFANPFINRNAATLPATGWCCWWSTTPSACAPEPAWPTPRTRR